MFARILTESIVPHSNKSLIREIEKRKIPPVEAEWLKKTMKQFQTAWEFSSSSTRPVYSINLTDGKPGSWFITKNQNLLVYSMTASDTAYPDQKRVSTIVYLTSLRKDGISTGYLTWRMTETLSPYDKDEMKRIATKTRQAVQKLARRSDTDICEWFNNNLPFI